VPFYYIILSFNFRHRIPGLRRPREARKLLMHLSDGLYGALPRDMSQSAAQWVIER
jgi:hypothetical protein